MTTGPPIYLVSACASGEEFVAAFRRYADKTGLFIPIAEPLPAGRRGRFAVSLKDGGVMVEGEAEVVSSAKTPSVVHGRIGMTLKFLEPDDPSRTVLGELERARLAMKPAPPSVPPRPAELPAEPRPVPPSPAGRIDAVNALAECVAIGDVATLGGGIAPPPKAGPRFVVPTIPPPIGGRAKGTTAPPIPAMPRTSTTLGVMPLPKPWPASASLGAASPGPGDDAGVAERGPQAKADGAATLPELVGASAEPSAPEEPPKRSTAPLPPPEPPRRITAPLPPPEPPRRTTGTLSPPSPPAPPKRTTAPLPSAEPPKRTTAPLPTVAPDPLGADRSGVSETMTAEVPPDELVAQQLDESATMYTMPDPERGTSDTINAVIPTPDAPDDAVLPGPATEVMATPPLHGRLMSRDTPAPPILPDASGEGPAPIIIAATQRRDDPTLPMGGRLDTHPTPRAPAPPAPTSGSFATLTPSRTATPVAPMPIVVKPATAAPQIARPSIEIAEPTDLTDIPFEPPVVQEHGPRRTVIGLAVVPSGVEVGPAAPPDTALELIEVPPVAAPRASKTGLPVVEEATPSGDWTMTPGPEGSMTMVPRTPPPVVPPTGDWTIALDPEAPDGWTEPSQVDRLPLVELPPGPPVSAVASASALEAIVRPEPELAELEPKVQIDPTLIEPGKADGPSHGAGLVPISALAEPSPPPVMMMLQGPPMAYAAPVPSPSATGQSPAFPMDSSRSLSTADLRYPSASFSTSYPAPESPRRLIAIIAAAAVAAITAIAVIFMVTRKSHSKPEPPTAVERGVTAPVRELPPPAVPPDAAVVSPSIEVDAGAAPAAECSVDVTATPKGTDIFTGDTTVVGTAPAKIALPCSDKIELTFRKKGWLDATRTVTPTPDGAKVKIALGRPQVSLKVSTMPPGATITVNGRSLGVTPTTIKLPEFETTTLTITHDGFSPDIERVTPKSNGGSLHTTLKKTPAPKKLH